MTLGYVDFQSFFQRQATGTVLEQRHAFSLRFLAVGAESVAAHQFVRGFRVKVGVFKQAAAEDIGQQPCGGCPHPLGHGFLAQFFTAQAVSFQHGLRVVVASELIHAVQDGDEHPLGFSVLLHVVAPAGESVHVGGWVLGDAPVGAHYAGEAVLLPQQIVDDVFAVGVPDVLSVLFVQAPGHGVVRHHGGSTLRRPVQPKRGFGEGLFVLCRIIGGIHRVFAESVMRVSAALAGATAGPVLHHGVHAVMPPAAGRAVGGLHPVAVGFDQLFHVLRFHAQRVGEAHPAGFGAQIDLRAQRGGNAHSAVFQGSVVRELLHHLRVEARREAHALGPFAHVAARGLELGGRFFRAAAGI